MQTPHTRGTLSLAIVPKMVDGGGVAYGHGHGQVELLLGLEDMAACGLARGVGRSFTLAFAFAAVAASVRHSCGKRALEKKEM
jgi:hypothetical protein